MTPLGRHERRKRDLSHILAFRDRREVARARVPREDYDVGLVLVPDC